MEAGQIGVLRNGVAVSVVRWYFRLLFFMPVPVIR
jgi:hypothetical protein